MKKLFFSLMAISILSTTVAFAADKGKTNKKGKKTEKCCPSSACCDNKPCCEKTAVMK